MLRKFKKYIAMITPTTKKELSNLKRQLTLDIKAQKEYVKDVEEAYSRTDLKHRYFLGNFITNRTVWLANKELRLLKTERNELNKITL